MKIKIIKGHMTTVEKKLAHAILSNGAEVGMMAKSPRKMMEIISIDKSGPIWTAIFKQTELTEICRCIGENGAIEYKNRTYIQEVEIYGEGVVAMPEVAEVTTESETVVTPAQATVADAVIAKWQAPKVAMPEATNATVETAPITASARFFWNGVKIGDSKKLIKVWYSFNKAYPDRQASLTIYTKSSVGELTGLAGLQKNGSDYATDLYLGDCATITENMPEYIPALTAAETLYTRRSEKGDKLAVSALESIKNELARLAMPVIEVTPAQAIAEIIPEVSTAANNLIQVTSGKLGFVCLEKDHVATYSDVVNTAIVTIHNRVGDKYMATLDWGDEERFEFGMATAAEISEWLKKQPIIPLSLVFGVDVLEYGANDAEATATAETAAINLNEVQVGIPGKGMARCAFSPSANEEDREAVTMILANGISLSDVIHHRRTKYKLVADPRCFKGFGVVLAESYDGLKYRIPFIVRLGDERWNEEALADFSKVVNL